MIYETAYLMHYGREGMKWYQHIYGRENSRKKFKRNTTVNVAKRNKPDKINRGHEANPRIAEPNTIQDHVNEDGKVTTRTFYGADGQKSFEIHTDDHGNPKNHPFGDHGEHLERYFWTEDGQLERLEKSEIPPKIREENDDIL